MSKEQHYKKTYGSWAGSSAGHKPDFTRCCEAVWSNERWSRETQCARKCGHGPDGAYCKQHDPAAKAAREAKQKAEYEAKWQVRRKEIHGARFFATLEKIAAGHNDARGLAQAVIDEFNTAGRR